MVSRNKIQCQPKGLILFFIFLSVCQKNLVLFVKTLPYLNRCFTENTAPRGFLSIMSSYKPKHADKECIFVLGYTLDTLGAHSVQLLLDVCFG